MARQNSVKVAITVSLIVLCLCLGLGVGLHRKNKNDASTTGVSANNVTPAPVGSLRGSTDSASKGTLCTEDVSGCSTTNAPTLTPPIIVIDPTPAPTVVLPAVITPTGGVETVTPAPTTVTIMPTTTPVLTENNTVVAGAAAGIDPMTGELVCVGGTKGVYSGVYEADPYSVSVCCPASCETCVDTPPDNAMEGFCGLGVENECCAIVSATLLLDTLPACTSSDVTPCVLEGPGICEDKNPCMNGSTCSLQYFTEYASVTKTLAVCECGAGYTGEFCEIQCGVDEQPCGASEGGYSGASFAVNNTCCGSNVECVRLDSKYSWSTMCMLKDRPLYGCDTSADSMCLNGGTCTMGNAPTTYCDCLPGFGGALCETPTPDITCTSDAQTCFNRPPNQYLGQSTSPDYCCADNQMCECGMTTCGCIDTPVQA